jgi:hypothetical protein
LLLLLRFFSHSWDYRQVSVPHAQVLAPHIMTGFTFETGWRENFVCRVFAPHRGCASESCLWHHAAHAALLYVVFHETAYIFYMNVLKRDAFYIRVWQLRQKRRTKPYVSTLFRNGTH